MRKFLVMLIFFNSQVFYGQRIKTNDVIEISRNYIKDTVGNDLINFFNFLEPSGSYYKIKKKNKGYQPSKGFGRNQKIKKNVTEIWALWNFNFPEIRGINCGLWVKLDSNMKLIEPLDLDFIPAFLWKNEPSTFIGIEKAKEIGENIKTKTEFGTDEPKLMFDYREKIYIYEIWNKKTQIVDYDSKKHGVLEVIIIDATTGNVLKVTNGYYGKIIIR